MVLTLEIASAALALASLLAAVVLVVRRVVLAARQRSREAREARVRPLAIALIEDDEAPGGLSLAESEALAAALARYARHVSGESRERISAFFERRGDVAREIARLGDRRAHRRATAAHVLGDMASPTAVPALRAALGDPVRDVRAAAARSLGCLGAGEGVAELVAALVSKRVPRGVAGQALLAIGPRAVAPLLALTRGTDAEVHAVALELIGLLGDAGEAPELQRALRHGAAQVRAAGARALGRLGAREDAARLRELLGDRVPFVRVAAAEALGAIGDLAAVPALLAQAREPRHESAQAAASALLKLVPRGLAVVGSEPGAPPYLREAADRAIAARAA